MQVIHLNLRLLGEDYAELRYFLDNPNRYQSRRLPLAEVSELISTANRNYYVPLPADYVVTGRRLYDWLDGDSRFLQRALDEHRRQGIILAISTTENLAHLPWEVLHDGKGFLVQRQPTIIPLRWVADRQCLSVEDTPENRSLQVLFMATSPLGITPVLDFEGEEGRILDATKRQPLSLIVEESGCLTELGYLVKDYDRGSFDVLHLTGHATFEQNQPRFITETETGEPYYASAKDIAKELQFQMPKLIFLSGCRTGQSPQSGAVPSMAEALLDKGAKVVLGWGKKVLDRDATVAAEALYRELAAGRTVTEAVGITYQTLIENQARDWHLLRLYVAETLPGGLVTPLRKPGRKPAPRPSVATQFLDPQRKVKVPTRQSFIGRRRQLQNCLRELKLPLSDLVGVLIHGMGGLGKSSLAARLCDRLPEFERVVWVGSVDEPYLVNHLTNKLDTKELRETLQDPHEELKFRLRRVFRGLETSKPFLLVLDDFERNLEPRGDGYVLLPEAVMVLEALIWAILETDNRHRMVITSRYDFQSVHLEHFHKQPLDALRGADLRKKCKRLLAFGEQSQVEEALQSQAKGLADGNPRLLEWLDKILLSSTVDRGAILQRLEVDPVALREQVLAQALLEQMDGAMREMLSRGLVFELPVPRKALVVVCQMVPDMEGYLDRAVALGLLEVSPDESLRVPRILPLRLPESAEPLYRQAAEVLYSLWEVLDTEEQGIEIHRLALQGKLGKMAADMAFVLTRQWNDSSRWREAMKTCQVTLELVEDHRIFHQQARSEELLGAVEQAIAHYQQALELCLPEDEQEKASILHNMASIYVQEGQVQQALNLFEQSLEIEERTSAVGKKAATLHQMAIIYVQQGEIEQALNLFKQSLEITEGLNYLRGKAATLSQMANIYARQGEIEQALNLYQQSLEIEEDTDDWLGQAGTLQQIASIYAQQGKVQKALKLFQQSLDIEEDIDDLQGKGQTLHSMAIIYVQQGEVQQALKLFQQSLDIAEGIDNLWMKASTLNQMGDIYINRGEVQQALELCKQSLEIAERIGSVKTKTAALNNLARIYARQGEVQQALGLYQQSLEIDERTDDVQGKAVTLHNMAGIYADLGEIQQALAFYRQCLEIAERIDDVKMTAAVLQAMGTIYSQKGEVQQALELYQQSLEISQRFNDVGGKAVTLHNMAGIYADLGEIQQALTFYQQSLAIDECINHVWGQVANLQAMGHIYSQQGEIQQALALYQRLLAIFEHINNVPGKAATLHHIAGIYTQQGEIQQAITLYQQSLEIFERIDNMNVHGKARTLAMLGDLLAAIGDFEAALGYLQQSLEILQHFQSPNADIVKEAIANLKQMAENREV